MLTLSFATLWAFSGGKIVSDDGHAPGVEIGRPNDTYRRVRIESGFGKVTVLATDGHLPYPYGREMTGYEVANLSGYSCQATKASGATVLVDPYTGWTDARRRSSRSLEVISPRSDSSNRTNIGAA